jgi:hypothetical protein
MIILAPIFIIFVMIVVAFGRYVAVRGDVEAATRDAVRAASFERDSGSAGEAAAQAAQAALNGKVQCVPTDLGGDFEPGGIISVTLSCKVSYSGLGLLGLPGTVSFKATSQAPLDLYRRVDDGT